MGKQILIAVICHQTGKTEYYPLTVGNLHTVIKKYLPEHHLVLRKNLVNLSQHVITGFRSAQDELDRLLR